MNAPTAVARHLDSLGLVTYDGPGWDVAIDTMPDSPSQVVAITGYGGPQTHAGRGWDRPSIQIRVRGTQDPRVSRGRCQAIYDALHGLSNVELPGPLWVTNCVAITSSPQAMGMDANNRHEHVVSFELEVRNPARPAV